MPSTPSQCDLILDALSAGEWVPMPELARISGSLNIHSRIDQLRHERGLHIENSKTIEAGTRKCLSSYRLVSPEGSPAPQTPQPASMRPRL